jgi:hypothetical protein
MKLWRIVRRKLSHPALRPRRRELVRLARRYLNEGKPLPI